MNKKIIFFKTSIALLFLVLFITPRVSFADWGGHHDGGHFYHYHDHPHFGLHVSFLPDGYYPLWIGGVRYYYYDGLYYSYVGDGDYVLVSPPVGAVVAAIPPDFQPIIINGVTYYVNNGVYYLYTHHGYQVVRQPTVQVVTSPAPAIVISAPVAIVPQDSFTVNVPNNSGKYTAVVIKRSGKGYLGPQGEFYPDFPKVAQLKVMYGK